MTRPDREKTVLPMRGRPMRGVRAILAATALAVAAGLAPTASTASADTLRHAPAAQRLDDGRHGNARLEAMHRQRLEERRQAARDRQEKKRHERHERRARSLDRHDVVKVLNRHGYHKVRDVRRVGQVYRAEAVTRHGRTLRVVVDARSGDIVDVERLHWPRPAYRW